MEVFYTDFSKIIGLNYKDCKKPLYLTENVIFIVYYGKNKKLYKQINKGFKSDGCSIPKIFWLLIGCPHTTKYIPASFIHDYIIQHPEIVNNNLKFSSEIFLQCLLNEGVHHLKAKIMAKLMTFFQLITNWKHGRWK